MPEEPPLSYLPLTAHLGRPKSRAGRPQRGHLTRRGTHAMTPSSSTRPSAASGIFLTETEGGQSPSPPSPSTDSTFSPGTEGESLQGEEDGWVWVGDLSLQGKGGRRTHPFRARRLWGCGGAPSGGRGGGPTAAEMPACPSGPARAPLQSGSLGCTAGCVTGTCMPLDVLPGPRGHGDVIAGRKLAAGWALKQACASVLSDGRPRGRARWALRGADCLPPYMG